MIPVYGQGFFYVSLGGVIWYTIIFDYYDEEELYYRLLKRGGQKLREELDELRANMQKLMEEEKIVINGEKVEPVVERAYIEIRGEPVRPSVVFLTRMNFKHIRGRNVYEDFYEPTKAEYDYTVTWVAPPCTKFVEYEGPGRFTLEGNVLRLYVKRGTKIDGYESIVFDTSTCGTP